MYFVESDVFGADRGWFYGLEILLQLVDFFLFILYQTILGGIALQQAVTLYLELSELCLHLLVNRIYRYVRVGRDRGLLLLELIVENRYSLFGLSNRRIRLF